MPVGVLQVHPVVLLKRPQQSIPRHIRGNLVIVHLSRVIYYRGPLEIQRGVVVRRRLYSTVAFFDRSL